MRTTKTFYEQTIIENIDFSGYEDDPDIYGDYPLYTNIQNVYSIFKKEYVHDNNSFMNEHILFKDWLQGLPSILTVPFMNCDIIENAKKSGFAFETKQQEDRFLDAYWSRLSNAFFTLKENI
jgi:hypothetical protein